MKRIIATLFLLLNVGFVIGYTPPADNLPPVAGPPEAVAGMLVQKKGVVSPPDDCTGDLGTRIHFENVDVTQGNPAGCTRSGNNTGSLSGAILGSGDSYDGTFSLSVGGANNVFLFPWTVEDLDVNGEGKIFCYFNITTFNSGAAFLEADESTANRFQIRMSGAAGAIDIGFQHAGGGTSRVCTNGAWDTTENGWRYFELGWNVGSAGITQYVTGCDAINVDDEGNMRNRTDAGCVTNECSNSLGTFTADPTGIEWGNHTNNNAVYYQDRCYTLADSGL